MRKNQVKTLAHSGDTEEEPLMLVTAYAAHGLQMFLATAYGKDNTGQTFWDTEQGYRVEPYNLPHSVSYPPKGKTFARKGNEFELRELKPLEQLIEVVN